ncbi:MAG: D-alanyl-D-alanine carboxypeptidase/D-alanyl-D-alanine-endopeptidase [Bacteroidia bacterium]|nr:D-alanyl-D-alanine carboxypeptidase/D-alanyl-D-alanine-endopeptidase [Bacteroidia bacterium]
MFKRYILLIIATLIINQPTLSQKSALTELKQYVSSLQNMEGMTNASYGFCLMDEKGSLLAQHDMNRSLLTASTMKVITTATALAVLGEGYRYKTFIEYDGEIQNGVLNGNVYIRGTGDPSTGSDRFGNEHSMENVLRKWGEEIRKAGILKIKGKVIGDATLFSSQTIPDNWVWADIGNYYGTGASGLCLNENMYKIHLKTGNREGDPVQLLYWDENMKNLQFINELTTGKAGSGDNSFIFGAPYTTLRYIRGTLPPGHEDFVIKGSVPDPEGFAAEMLCDKLAEMGIPTTSGTGSMLKLQVEGGVSSLQRNPIYTHLSPPLKEIVYWTNQKSVNLFAECLLSTIALMKTGVATTKKGIEEVWKFWEQKGIASEGMFLQDGSGLSPNNAVTAYQMTSVLHKISGEPWFPALFSSLPVSGKSGTLSSMTKDTPAEGKIHAKSGYMSRVRTYAGYVTTKSGKRYSFTIFANNYNDSASAMKKRLEELFVKLAELE